MTGRARRRVVMLVLAAVVVLGVLGANVLTGSDDGFSAHVEAAPPGPTTTFDKPPPLVSPPVTAPPVGSAAPSPVPSPAPSPAGPARTNLPPVGPTDLAGWRALAAKAMDSETLADGTVTLPFGANVFAARIYDGGPVPAYAFYEAGGGAFSNEFYPASSIKLEAALGALTYVRSLGFTGEATIDGGYTLHDIYDAAIRYSSNEDYSWLVRIAGVEWLNREFLPSEGFLGTSIQEAYGGEGEQVAYSPPMTLAEGDKTLDVDARSGYDDYGCGGGNCADLFDLADAIRRTVLNSEVSAGERFAIAPSDVAGLTESLLGAESWIEPGVRDALGPDALIYSKPGWVGGLDCVDAGLVVDQASGRRYLIALSVPDVGDECGELGTMAYQVITALATHDDGYALRPDGAIVTVAHGKQVS